MAVDDDDLVSTLSRAMSTEIETEAEREAREPITHTRTGTSIGSTASRPPDFEVVYDENDPEDPKNWPKWYKGWCLIVVSYSTWLVVLYSTSYTSATPGLIEEFGSNVTYVTLGMTTYLLGLAVGCVVLAPLSELYGRRPVYLVCQTAWMILVIPGGVANSLKTIITMRFFCAMFGAAMISNGPGTLVDITRPEVLALVMSIWSIAPLNGPVTGPLIGGFVFADLGWRWTAWIVLILAGTSVAMLLTVKETYPPIILKRKAARMRKEMDDPRWWCRYDQRISSLDLLKVNLSRPFILFFTEPILWFLNIWISVIYGVLYLCFVAYPVVFTENRGWGPGISGLAFLGIGIGTLCAIASEPLCRRIVNSQRRDPETGKVRPEATALIMAIGACSTALGQLGFSWTCLPTSIHWAVPIAFGIPFGAGNTLSFIYGSHYLAGAYEIFAASALAGNAVVRSVFGAVLPLAGPKMYEVLKPRWAGTLLGLLEVALIPIPFVFWRYGDRIRAKSPVIKQLKEDQERVEAKRARYLARLERRGLREKTAGVSHHDDEV